MFRYRVPGPAAGRNRRDRGSSAGRAPGDQQRIANRHQLPALAGGFSVAHGVASGAVLGAGVPFAGGRHGPIMAPSMPGHALRQGVQIAAHFAQGDRHATKKRKVLYLLSLTYPPGRQAYLAARGVFIWTYRRRSSDTAPDRRQAWRSCNRQEARGAC